MYRISGNLDAIRSSIRLHFGAVTIGWIGDSAHRSSISDHNPDSRGIVCAIDVMFPVGPKASAVVKACVGRHDLRYVIHNRTIWEKKNGWKARAYKGTDPHTNHVHISSEHNAEADGFHVGLTWDGSIVLVKVSKSTLLMSHTPQWRFPGTVRRGSRGRAVKAVQQRLKDRGWKISVDGSFGPGTEAIVRRFQGEKGLKVDGIVGPTTWLYMCNAPR